MKRVKGPSLWSISTAWNSSPFMMAVVMACTACCVRAVKSAILVLKLM